MIFFLRRWRLRGGIRAPEPSDGPLPAVVDDVEFDGGSARGARERVRPTADRKEGGRSATRAADPAQTSGRLLPRHLRLPPYPDRRTFYPRAFREQRF